VLQWLIKAYTKDSCCFYCDRVEHSTGYRFRGIYNSIHGPEEITISKEAKQATLNKIYQRQQGFGQLYIPGVEYLPDSPEHTYLAMVKLQHTMSMILVEGTTPLSFDKEEWEYNKDNNNGKNNDLNDNGNNNGENGETDNDNKNDYDYDGDSNGNNYDNFDGELDVNLMVGKEELLGPRGGVYIRDYNNDNGIHMDYNSHDSNDNRLFSNDNFVGELYDNIMVDEEEQVAQRGSGDDGDNDKDNNNDEPDCEPEGNIVEDEGAQGALRGSDDNGDDGNDNNGNNNANKPNGDPAENSMAGKGELLALRDGGEYVDKAKDNDDYLDASYRDNGEVGEPDKKGMVYKEQYFALQGGGDSTIKRTTKNKKLAKVETRRLMEQTRDSLLADAGLRLQDHLESEDSSSNSSSNTRDDSISASGAPDPDKMSLGRNHNYGHFYDYNDDNLDGGIDMDSMVEDEQPIALRGGGDTRINKQTKKKKLTNA
jgi:hypothetical protein